MARQFDEHIMRRALQIARCGEGFTSPNPMVGAVIVRPDGSIAGEGFTSPWGGPHAEVNAVASVPDKKNLPDCTIYVTLEPCSHQGKTPPCADMLVESGIRRCVVGTVDPFEKVAGRGIEIMRRAGIEVTVGVLENECRELNRRFFLAHTLRRTYVILKWAESADRYMANPDGTPATLSDPAGRVLVHSQRALTDAILVGTNTVLTDNPQLDCRLWPNRQLIPVIPDPKGIIPADAQVMRPETIILREEMTEADIARKLYTDHGLISLMVEGGPTTLQRWIDSGIFDELRIESTATTFPRLPDTLAADITSPRLPDTLAADILSPKHPESALSADIISPKHPDSALADSTTSPRCLVKAPRLPDLPYTFTPQGTSTLLRWLRSL